MPKKIDPENLKAVAEDYRKGLKYREILEKYKPVGGTKNWIEKAIMVYGLEPRVSREAAKPKPKKQGHQKKRAEREIDKSNRAIDYRRDLKNLAYEFVERIQVLVGGRVTRVSFDNSISGKPIKISYTITKEVDLS